MLFRSKARKTGCYKIRISPIRLKTDFHPDVRRGTCGLNQGHFYRIFLPLSRVSRVSRASKPSHPEGRKRDAQQKPPFPFFFAIFAASRETILRIAIRSNGTQRPSELSHDAEAQRRIGIKTEICVLSGGPVSKLRVRHALLVYVQQDYRERRQIGRAHV